MKKTVIKKIKILIILIVISLVVSYFAGFLSACYIENNYQLIIDFSLLNSAKTFELTFLFAMVAAVLLLIFCSKTFDGDTKKLLEGNKDDLDLLSNLEQSKFQTDREIKTNFKIIPFKALREKQIVGTIIKAEAKRNNFNVVFAGPAHSLVIGTTGSGKTTTYVNPTIQILSETKTKPSLLIADPKGELYIQHAQSLIDKGYDIKVLDLRNPYNSIRWNPLERPYVLYQRMIHLEKEIKKNKDGTFSFEDQTFQTEKEAKTEMLVTKQKIYDEVYEDLHDIMTVLCPINNTNEPLWESGAKNLILSIALAMLEDSENSKLKLTKEKYNFFSISKVATNTENDCEELFNYFKNRSPLSKATALSKQVLDSSEKTRGSYLSSTFDKISMFSDQSLCALTSENEIEFAQMGEKPIALFLQIPDEKETRHTLASMVVLQVYKELVHKANECQNLTLPRPVYFILDEFGNLPKIPKIEQMITVGRSRNIWFNLIIQSYAQLSKVYGDKVADIIKSNCNVQIFIGTTDYKTIEEFSKKCGNFSIVQRSLGYSANKTEDIKENVSIKERPLIYPSELQRLNNNKNMGNAIVTIFGYHPVKSKLTPSFENKFFIFPSIKQEKVHGRYFDEKNAFFDMKKRNALFAKKLKGKDLANKQLDKRKKSKLMLEQIKELTTRALFSVVNIEETNKVLNLIDTLNFEEALVSLELIKTKAKNNNRKMQLQLIEDIIQRIKDFIFTKK